MGIKYDGNAYEMLWRPNFELRSSIAWASSALGSIGLGVLSEMPSTPFVYMGVLASGMAVSYLPKAYQLWKMQRYLQGRPLSFMTQDELHKRILPQETNAEKVKNKLRKQVDNAAISIMWLGLGFRWEQRHCQRIYEIMKRDWSDFYDDDNDDPNQMGQPWIHGVEPEESDIEQPLKHSEGHVSVSYTHLRAHETLR